MPPKPAPETLSIRLAAHEAPDVTRLIELRSEQKLRDLVTAGTEAFQIEDLESWRVFLSNKPWDRASEWSHEGRGRHAKLRDLALAPGARFLLVAVDNGERWLRGEVIARGTVETGVKYPRVLERHGEAPNPFAHLDNLFGFATGRPARRDNDDEEEEPDVDQDDESNEDEGDSDILAGADTAANDENDSENDNDDDGSRVDPLAPASESEAALLARAAECATAWDAHFEREDAADVPRPAAQVARDAAVARELAETFGAQPERFDALAAEQDAPVTEWLDMLLFDMEDHAMFDQALALAESLANLLGPGDVGATRAQILISAGRPRDAVEQLENTLWEFPDDATLRARAAGIFQRANELVRAEDLARSVLDAELDETEESAYADAIDVLDEILRASERADEADAIARSEKAQRGRSARENSGDDGLDDPLGAIQSMLADATAVRKTQPRVGRNDPCPCGSGKKYRDCHGA